MTQARDDRRKLHDRLVAEDKAYLWHPFTPMRRWLDGEPLVIESADGFELIDTRGNRYIDGHSSLWCNLHGHRVAQIDAAVREQLSRVAHTTLLGLAGPPSIELARRLVEIAPRGNGDCTCFQSAENRDCPRSSGAEGDSPRLTKVFFSDSGATAVEVALKMAFQYFHNIGRPRRKFLALRDGYHGDTVGAVSLGGIDTFHALFRPLLFPATFVDSPNPYHHPAKERAGDAVLKQIEQALADAPGEYAAVVVEPLIQAAGGMLTHPGGFLAGLRELTRRHGVLLIADEVATGFCRTGRLFACQHECVVPDMLCLGKGLTGGYLPVAATLTTREIFDAFLGDAGEGRTFYHGHTYTGNALGCAAACASIDLIFESGLLEKLPGKVELIRSRLEALRGLPRVADIRQCGMMVGIELKNGDCPRFSRFSAAAVCRAALGRGVIIRPLGDVVVLMPAPAMDEGTLSRMMSAVVESIHECLGQDPA